MFPSPNASPFEQRGLPAEVPAEEAAFLASAEASSLAADRRALEQEKAKVAAETAAGREPAFLEKAASSVPEAIKADPAFQEIERILQKDLEDVPAMQDEAGKAAFAARGQQVAERILQERAKFVRAPDAMVHLVGKWLESSPATNKAFLAQQAFIKAAALLALLRKPSESSLS